MGLITGVSRLLDDISDNILYDSFTKLESRNLHSVFVEIISTVNKVMEKVIMHYPKTLMICFIAHVIFTIVFPSIRTFIGLAIDCYLFYPYRNHMFSAIKIHRENNISEWFSSYEDKKKLEKIIHIRAYGNGLLQRITNFFKGG